MLDVVKRSRYGCYECLQAVARAKRSLLPISISGTRTSRSIAGSSKQTIFNDMGKPKGKGGGGKEECSSSGGSGALGTCSQVKVRHILCEKHSKVMEALAKIQAGEKFDAVAQAYSEDAARKGGDLGWKRRNELVGPFAEAAFKLQVGQMSDVIKTQFGYHIILCEGRKA